MDEEARLYPTVAGANAARFKRSYDGSDDIVNEKSGATKRTCMNPQSDTSKPISSNSSLSSASLPSPSYESVFVDITTTPVTSPKLTTIPQELQIEIFSHCTNPHSLRLVNRSFHQVSQLAISKALWLIHRYPYYKVLERSLRYRFFDVHVAKTMHALNPLVFCSRYYVRKAVLKLDKEKYRYRAAKKILQHFILITGKHYFGLDSEDDTHFPLGKSLGDDHAMDIAIKNRQWATVQAIGSLSDGYGYWTHAPFARDSLSRLLEEAPFLVSTLHHDAPPRDYISALRTCLYMLSCSYPTTIISSPLPHAHPYSNKHLARLALQSHHPTIYRPVLDKIAPALSSRDKQAIMDDVAFDATDDNAVRDLIEIYRFPVQYGCNKEKPLFALAWHNMHSRISLLLAHGFNPRLIVSTSCNSSFLHDLLCADNTSLELYMTLLDAGTPLEPNAMRKIVTENTFDGVLLGYILKHWERCETRVPWEVVIDMIVDYRGEAKSLANWSGRTYTGEHGSVVEDRERKELEMDEEKRVEEMRREDEDADADDEGAEQLEGLREDEGLDRGFERMGERNRKRGVWENTDEEMEEMAAEAAERAERRKGRWEWAERSERRWEEMDEEMDEDAEEWRWREELEQG